MVRPLPLRTAFDRTRSSAFAYACGACARCCYGKVIPLNPYEVARLAAHHGITTTEALSRFTDDCGASLKSRADGSCVFLGSEGCTVHAARPLACRLYPLGRHVGANGDETFAEVEPHPETAGVYGGDGTVADYLEQQGAPPYIAASNRYLALFRRMVTALARRDDAAQACDDAKRITRTSPDDADATMLDVDAVVSDWCRERGLSVPEEVEGRVALHIAALEAQLDEP